jgi:hypothetical protein
MLFAKLVWIPPQIASAVEVVLIGFHLLVLVLKILSKWGEFVLNAAISAVLVLEQLLVVGLVLTQHEILLLPATLAVATMVIWM